MPPPVEKRGLNPCQLLVEFIRKRGAGGGELEPERGASDHLNPTCDSPAQVSYSGGSKVSLRGVFTALVTHRHADH